jgi:TatD DNase family protein
MTDAHSHVVRGETRHFLCEPFGGRCEDQASQCAVPSDSAQDVLFFGWHPWFLDGFDADALRRRLAERPDAGVGEIGLDRLRERTIPQAMREAFEVQLDIAAELSRPVVLHGAKCWGEVVKACMPRAGRIPAFLFHGFSRSAGLIPDIVRINGFVSIGPALLNDHAVNYRELAKAVPADRVLVESDATDETAAELPRVGDIADFLADLRGVPRGEMASVLESNADRFVGCCRR